MSTQQLTTTESISYSVINSICDEILICPICLGTIDNVLLLDCCMNRYCNACIMKYLKQMKESADQQKSCPCCKHSTSHRKTRKDTKYTSMIHFFQGLQREVLLVQEREQDNNDDEIELDLENKIENQNPSRQLRNNAKQKQIHELKRATNLYEQRTRELIEMQRKKRKENQSLSSSSNSTSLSMKKQKNQRNMNSVTSITPTSISIKSSNAINLLLTRHFKEKSLNSLLYVFSKSYMYNFSFHNNGSVSENSVIVKVFDSTTIEDIKNFIIWNHNFYICNNESSQYNNSHTDACNQNETRMVEQPILKVDNIDIYIPDRNIKTLWRIDNSSSTLCQLVDWCRVKDIKSEPIKCPSLGDVNTLVTYKLPNVSHATSSSSSSLKLSVDDHIPILNIVYRSN